MAKKQETNKPFTPKPQGTPYDGGCPVCKGTRKIQAPTAPGFEGRPTFPIPCPNCTR